MTTMRLGLVRRRISGLVSATPPSPRLGARGCKRQLGSFTDAVIVPLQAGLLTVHETTGLPWWAGLCVASAGLRVALLPALYVQLRASSRLAQAMPDLMYINSLLQSSLKDVSKSDVSGRLEKYQASIGAMHSTLAIHKANPLLTIISPALQIPVFISFVVATRGLVNAGGHGLEQGGILWFTDLTAPDETLVLPVLAVAATYANIEAGFQRQQQPAASNGPSGKAPPDGAGGFVGIIKDIFQTALIIGLPLTTTLPAGAYMYWLTSAAFSAVQMQVLRNPAVREALGLVPMRKTTLAEEFATQQKAKDNQTGAGK
uniref:Membrane insertase YidC/Oxa/ALB C-terminal domain-containing protein n=1 Tax=Rhizochromulina marina TaxID=1034831 RepID=A0A7S2WRU7_9STRA|mmetsp:Transcript_31438/g.91437  ORF Transcript_31438/g.91437 Transcript_31438/m.91437 type:complete len:316 (+) Transcript_31438:1-948(+)